MKLVAHVSCPFAVRRAPRGARGLKQSMSFAVGDGCGRAPRGARGLKPAVGALDANASGVAPRAGRVD